MQFGRAIRSNLAWLSLLVYLLAGFGSAFGADCCLAKGEDCQLESANTPCCQAQGPNQLAERPFGEESCGSCTGTVVSQFLVKSRVRPLRAPLDQDSHLVLTALPSPFPSDALKNLILPRLTAPPASLVLAQLRTVVLLH